jgi:hypothetical protein
MKSFSQFLQESYLNEGVAPGERIRSPKEQAEWDKIDQREKEQAARRAKRKPSGAAARPDLQFKSTKVQSPTTSKKPSGAARDPWKQFPKKPQQQMGLPKEGPSSRLPGRTLEPAGGTSPRPALSAAGQTAKGDKLVKASPATPSTRPTSTSSIDKPQQTVKTVKVVDLDSQRRRDAKAKLRSAAAGTGPSGKPIITPPPKVQQPSSSATPSQGKPPTGPKPTGKWAKIGKFAGPASAALDTALSTADERSKGSGWARSLAKGATVAAGGLAGGALGALGGGGIGSAALGTAGAIGGAELAGKAFDVAAGANAKERKAMATANRQRQAGTAIKGIGGPTSFDTKKNTMTTGSGSQRRTVQLAKTGVVQRGGQSVAGHLAYKGGQAVYKAAPSAQYTSSNPLERIGRALFAKAYKKHDAAKAQQALQKARQNDAARNKKLGVKFGPGK